MFLGGSKRHAVYGSKEGDVNIHAYGLAYPVPSGVSATFADEYLAAGLANDRDGLIDKFFPGLMNFMEKQAANMQKKKYG